MEEDDDEEDEEEEEGPETPHNMNDGGDDLYDVHQAALVTAQPACSALPDGEMSGPLFHAFMHAPAARGCGHLKETELLKQTRPSSR